MKDKQRSNFGIVQWFGTGDYSRVTETVKRLADLGVTHLRTGISWAEYALPEGPAWYDWMIRELSESGLILMVSLCYTPPDLSETGDCRGAPRSPEYFWAFMGEIAEKYAHMIDEFQIWNEPNCWDFWNRERDPRFEKFSMMSRPACEIARESGSGVVLGGIIAGNGWAPKSRGWQPDAEFLITMREQGILELVDAIAYHAFPGMWVSGDPEHPVHPEESWNEPEEWWVGWERKTAPYRLLGGGLPVVVTETGFSTFDYHAGVPGLYDEQTKWLERAVRTRVMTYWYSLFDIPRARQSIGGDQGGDPRNYHFGLVREDGSEKPAYHALKRLLGNESDRD